MRLCERVKLVWCLLREYASFLTAFQLHDARVIKSVFKQHLFY